MRLTSYNILDGGVGRADPLAEVIEASRADVVVLVEADDADVTERIAKRLGMEVASGGGGRRPVAILSRWAICESVSHGSLHPGSTAPMLEACLQTPTGAVLPVFAVHLHPRAREVDEQTRMDQLGSLIRITAPLRAAGTPHLLAGDFNANSPTQKIDWPRAYPRTREEAQLNGGDVPRRVVRALLDAGYLDTFATRHPDLADTTGSFTTQYPEQRVDYIFTFGIPAPSIRQAWIEHDRLATYASDHYPIGVEINLP